MIQEKLLAIQKALKAPKSQYNSFGKYKYRNCEDILEAVKPLLGDCLLTVSDDIVLIGIRYYVKATAALSFHEENIEVTAYAREEESKKGMDGAQVTGAASSYARKYALNGLLLIDDTKDADTTNQHDKTPPEPAKEEKPAKTDDIPANTDDIPANTGGEPVEYISEKQGKRLFAINAGAGWSTKELQEFLSNEYGVEKSAQIKKSDYEKICKHIEENKKI